MSQKSKVRSQHETHRHHSPKKWEIKEYNPENSIMFAQENTYHYINTTYMSCKNPEFFNTDTVFA